MENVKDRLVCDATYRIIAKETHSIGLGTPRVHEKNVLSLLLPKASVRNIATAVLQARDLHTALAVDKSRKDCNFLQVSEGAREKP